MKYYSEDGTEITEAEVDLTLGYLETRETETIPKQDAITHLEYLDINGFKITYTVVDSPAIPEHKEVISQTYILYADHPTVEDRVTALEDAMESLSEMI